MEARKLYTPEELAREQLAQRTSMENAAIGAKRLTARQELLREAEKITTGDRNTSYGNPEDNFRNIAAYWNSYFQQRGILKEGSFLISPQDIAHMMILMKMARLATNPTHRDSLVDIAGYAACGEDCRTAAVMNACGAKLPEPGYDSRLNLR